MTGHNHERTADARPPKDARFTTAEVAYRIATITAVFFLLATFV